jgi:hypothetical protein
MADDVESVAVAAAPEENGDDGNRLRLLGRFPAAAHRLEVFSWEWHADQDPGWRDWVRKMEKPVSQAKGVNTAGLLEAATEVAAVVQREIHELPSPLTHADVAELWYWRRTYLKALIYLDGGGNRLAKQVEASVAPDRQPLAICLGSTVRREYVMTFVGLTRFYGYVGCFNTFPDLPFGRGKRWPRLCPTCEPQRTNKKNKAIREHRRRYAEL